MKALNGAYLASHPGETSLCLFLIENVTGAEGIAGDMPRGKQFGYLFGGSTARTVAHEIGHGLFHLDHPFDRANAAKSFDRGDLADNLMEYQDGTNLVKLQWDAIHAPGLVIGLFERDESGMAKEESTDILSRIIEKILSVGENGCGFIRKQTSLTPNKELNISEQTETVDYLIGEIKNENISFSVELGSTQRTEISPQIIQFIRENEKKELILWVLNGVVQVCEAAEDYSPFSSLPDSKDSQAFLNKYRVDLFSCKGKKLLEILRQLKSYARFNQEVELFHEGKYYTIRNEKLELVSLSDAAINSGEWTETDTDTRIRYYINETGIIQVKAFGFRKNLPAVKNVDLSGLANQIKEQSNKFLGENQVRDFAALSPVFANSDEVFADGKSIKIGDGRSTFIRVVSEGIGLTATLLKTGEVEEATYLESAEGTATIRAPGLLTGGVEVVAQKVTDITALATTLYDLVVDKEVRSQLHDQFAAIRDEIGEDPQNFIPVLGNVLLTVATGNSAEEWQATIDKTSDTGKRVHLTTRGTGNAIITAISGAAIVNNLPEIAEQLTANIKKVKKVKSFIYNPFDELGRLKPNVRYRTGEFEYFGETDHLGRLERFDTENLQLTTRGERLPHNPDTPGKLEGDHAGHIFGDRFGGSPELDNLVSQASDVNLSKFKILENQWAKAIENGQKVELEIKISYESDALRPASFEVKYKIDGEFFDPPIINNK
jgi:hypothetical protein